MPAEAGIFLSSRLHPKKLHAERGLIPAFATPAAVHSKIPLSKVVIGMKNAPLSRGSNRGVISRCDLVACRYFASLLIVTVSAWLIDPWAFCIPRISAPTFRSSQLADSLSPRLSRVVSPIWSV